MGFCHRLAQLVPLTFAGLLLASVPARAQEDAFFPNDATLDASNPVSGRTFVGYANFDDYLNFNNPRNPTLTMLPGASVGTDMQLFNASILDMRGGLIGADFGSLLAYDQSTTNMSGGVVGQQVTLQHEARFNFSGGLVGDDVTSVDNSVLNITGGRIGHSLLINEQSSAFIAGGIVTADIFVQDASLLTIAGPDLISTLTDPDFQDFYSVYTLSGHLADGTELSGRTVLVQNGTGARLVVSASALPEPATLLLIGSGIGVGWGMRRQRSSGLRRQSAKARFDALSRGGLS